MNKEQFLTEVQTLATDYSPAPGVAQMLGEVELLAVMGPSAIGKSTTMRRVNTPRVTSVTSRAMRSKESPDNPYKFLDIDDFEKVLFAVQNGNFAQTQIHPTTGEFYGSYAADYPYTGPAMIDVVPQQVSGFNQFQSLKGAYFVTNNVEAWLQRTWKQAVSESDHSNRLNEAESSLLYLLGNTSLQNITQFITNDVLGEAPMQLRAIAAGNELSERSQRAGKAAAKKMLSSLFRLP